MQIATTSSFEKRSDGAHRATSEMGIMGSQAGLLLKGEW
jgi:hypothetical protein